MVENIVVGIVCVVAVVGAVWAWRAENSSAPEQEKNEVSDKVKE